MATESHIYRMSSAGGMTSDTRYPNMLTNYGDFGAMQRIAYIVADGTTGEYIFSNITQKYQDLMVVVNVKGVSNAGYGYLYLNGYGSNQSYTALTGNGTSAISTRSSNGSVMQWIPNTDQLSSTIPYSATFHILNYAETTTKKTVLARSAYDKNGSGGTQLMVGTYNVAGPITLIDFATFQAANFAAGSTFTLYGIRAGNS